MEYGNTADSLIEQQGKSSVQVWALNRVTDTKGNYYKIIYQDNGNATGEFYPTRIDYTGNANAGLSPYNSVRFLYETRPDSPVMYDNTGSRIQTTQRLINIQTYAKVNNADTLVKDYKLTYAISPATNRSRITQVTERDGYLNPLPATTITWDATGDATGNAVPTTVSTALWRSGANGWDHRYMGDFNGDGKTDLLAQWTDVATSGILCAGLDTSMSCPAITLPNGAVGKGVVADFNSDGYDDYLGVNQLCNGPALTTCVATGIGSPARSYVGNVNGDQYPDIIFYKAVFVRYVSGDEGSVYTFSRGYCLGPDLNTCAQASIGDYTVQGPPTLPPNVADVTVGDFNADGKTDLVYTLNTWNWGTYLCSGEAVGQGAAACTLMNSNSWGAYYQLHSSDFNGDGISDLYLIGDGGSYFCPGPGIATANNCQLVAGTAATWKTEYRVLPGDYNGDGVSDLYLVGAANSLFCAGPGITTANNCVSKVAGDWKSLYDIRPGDYDGDGTTDLFLITDTSRQFVEAGAGHADRVASITNGLGAVTSITYKPLTDATVYTKGTGANVMGNAYLELQAPMYVVSSVSSSNGVGNGTVGSNYFYWRARAHLTGGGFMGFEIVRSCDTNTTPNICTQTTYTQDYPHQGLTTKVLKFVKNGATFPYLNLVTNIWGYRSWTYSNNSLLGTIYHVPTLDTTQEVSYELASGGTAQGAVITNVTTTNTYDGYGNPMVITVSSTDASGQVYRKVTTNTYDNDTTGMNWLLGRLKTATVSSTIP